jgi:hypothetical protein
MPGKAAGIGKFPLIAQYVDENAVTALGVKPVNRLVENLIVVHRENSPVLFRPLNADFLKIQRERFANLDQSDAVSAIP